MCKYVAQYFFIGLLVLYCCRIACVYDKWTLFVIIFGADLWDGGERDGV